MPTIVLIKKLPKSFHYNSRWIADRFVIDVDRLVVLPEYQGIGIRRILADEVARHYFVASSDKDVERRNRFKEMTKFIPQIFDHAYLNKIVETDGREKLIA